MKNKVLVILSILIIIAGAVVVTIKGFNFDLKYELTDQVEMYIGKEFNNNDIKQIAKEVLQTDRVTVQKVEMFEDMVMITAYNITEDQKNMMVEKIKEKYELQDIEASDIVVNTVPHTRARDIMKPYVIPMAITAIVTIIYLAIRFRKLGVAKIIGKTIAILMLTQLVLWSIFAIVGIPIGRFTIPLMLLIYIISMLGMTLTWEKELDNKKKDEIADN